MHCAVIMTFIMNVYGICMYIICIYIKQNKNSLFIVFVFFGKLDCYHVDESVNLFWYIAFVTFL